MASGQFDSGMETKQFIEEAWPLALFAEAFYRDRFEVLFLLVAGSQSYDACLIDALTHRVQHYMQITLEALFFSEFRGQYFFSRSDPVS